MTGRFWKPARHATDATQALATARRAARLTRASLAELVGVHPRTMKRWEEGRTEPDAADWARVATAIAGFVPSAAAELARVVGAPSPLPPPVVVDARAIDEAILHAADRLDVAPGRVREALREIAAAVSRAHGTLDDLVRAVEEHV